MNLPELATGAGFASGLIGLAAAGLHWLRQRAKTRADEARAHAQVTVARATVETAEIEAEQETIAVLLKRIEKLETDLDRERERCSLALNGVDRVAYEVQQDRDPDDTGQHRLAELRRSITSDPPPRPRPLPAEAGLRRPQRGQDDEP